MPVRITPPAVVKVQVGQGTIPKATSVAYGAGRTLKSASDLNMYGAEDNDVITYKAATDSFELQRAGAGLTIDNGFF